ncbi:MAG: hypothetical protein WC365_06850 [Candidatus Babeliales bacterium]|jgi:hypothetical protein
MKYEIAKRGIENILKSTREAEREELMMLFHAQQPRLKDKVENMVMLETIIKQYLDVKYTLRPAMVAVQEKNPAEGRRYYSLILKIEDSIGRNLGRLGLTQRPQQYIPKAEQQSFDPKAMASVRDKQGLEDALK